MTRKSSVLLTGVLLAFVYNASTGMEHTVPDLASFAQRLLDTIPLEDRDGSFLEEGSTNPYDLSDPSVIDQQVEYDPVSGRYIITEKIGDDYYRAPTYMTFTEYMEWKAEQQEREYFARLAGLSTGKSGSTGLEDPLEEYRQDVNLVDRLFGGNDVSIEPQGNIDLVFGVRHHKTENPALPIRQQRQTLFDFDMDIRLNVTGQIGEKLSLSTNYNTQSQFDFENQLKLKFDSEKFSEDDILKNIEAGNVSLPLRSSLIQGSQSLFGIKTELQFGYLRITAIASQQKSKQKSIKVQGGNQVQEFEVRVDDYDDNRHFFITHYNRESYEDALKNLPQVNSLFKINRIEVWRTNIQNETERLRDIVAIADLAEPNRFVTNNADEFRKQSFPARLKDISGKNILPDNESNFLYERITNDKSAEIAATAIPTLSTVYKLETGRDFEVKRAQRLQQNEYSLNEQLGVLSLNTPLRQEEVLAVAVEYDYNGKTYRIGQFAAESGSDSTKVLFVKMLKSATPDVQTALWDLMMKNVYNVGAYQVDASTFNLDIYYDDAGDGYKRFLPEPGNLGRPLLQLFNLDQLNALGDPQSDGRFDFVPGVTINPQTGKVFFPVLEPFGSSLRDALDNEDVYNKYEYAELYDSTKFVAREYQEKNRFLLKGKFESSVTSEISLGAFNIPEGSVRVSAGGKLLVEGVDYEVDYKIGRLRILNESYLASGVPINISFEDNSLFSFQNRNMLGLRADYELSDEITLGGTYMHLWEQPITQKVNIGDDPINNRIVGLDASYTGEAPWLTKAVDFLPGLQTKEVSTISAYVEGAALIPGYSDAINLSADEEGSVYIDDFEGTAARIDISQPLDRWTLASIPQNDRNNNNPLFPEGELNNDRRGGMNRALINWYRIERGRTGDDPYTRIVNQNEIFPRRTLQPGLNTFRPLDITYYPKERGPYNYEKPEGSEYSAGLTESGELAEPESRWGGIMRGLNINDFQSSNIEYIEFWMLNPFINTDNQDRPAEGGELYIELGNISEDILKDGRAAYENGLPRPGQNVAVDTTKWGVVPLQAPFVNAFDNDPDVRQLQDVGLDGMVDEAERKFLKDYIDAMDAKGFDVTDDPANDNYLHFLDESWDEDTYLLDRFKRYNNTQGNSPVSTGNESYSTSFTFYPSTEDINRDFTSDKVEGYFQYKIPINRDGGQFKMQLNQYVTDTISTRGNNEIWYRFVVPIQEFTNKVGAIQDFRSIRFMRMYLRGFDEQVTMRFATLDLVRNSWRRFLRNNLLSEKEPNIDAPVDNTTFSINSVGIEENSQKVPYNYVLPPGIVREQNFQATNQNQFLNESSLAIEICELEEGDARAVFRNDQRDLRLYERLKMFVHAESEQMNEPGDLTIFLRMGSDYTENYYEYEIPLTMSQDIGESSGDVDVVWPEVNQFDFALQELVNLKKDRNLSSFPGNAVFERAGNENPDHVIKVKGNPNLGYVKGFMIGIRNEVDGNGTACVEVWTNELRVTGLDRKGGTAALGRLDMQLADFGTVSFSGSASSIGWGGISESLYERSRETVTQYDISTNLQLGKLLGENSPLRLPFYAQVSNTIKTPQFDPYDLDIELDDKLDAIADDEARDSVKNQAQDKTKITSINFTNVRIEPNRQGGGGGGGITPTGGQGRQGGRQQQGGGGGSGPRTPMPWDVENFSLSYAYTETDHTDPLIELDNTRNHTASLDYQYSYNPLYIEPFKNLVKNDKYLKFIKELHLNPLPNSFGASTNINRYINVRRYRFSNPKFSTWYDRRFTWDRTYSLRWDITRSLRMNFTATHLAVVDELDQYGVDFKGDTVNVDPDTYRWNNVKDFGRPKNYNHSVALSWNVPLQNFPFLDFIDVRAQTSANYSWGAAPINIDSLGNVIQNGQQRQVNTTVNFERLYNKWNYLRSLNQSSSRRRGPIGGQRGRNRGNEESSGPSVAEQILVRPLMIVRKAQFNWQEGYTNTVPGFLPNAELLGMSSGFTAPGWEYALGFQPTQKWLFEGAQEKGWFTASRFLSQEVINSYSNQWNGELSLEPWNDFRIDVTVNRSFQKTSTALFKNDSVAVPDPYNDYQLANYVYSPRNEYGSYTISYLAVNTLFRDGDDQLVELFEQFESNRTIISSRLNPNGDPHNEDGVPYKEGYGRKQQNVLIPAFISAYTDADPNNVTLDLFDLTPRPNWNIQYNGLSRIPAFQKFFRNVKLSHSYRSTLTVNSFQRNAAYDTDEDGFPEKDEESNFYSRFVIPEVVVDERFNPLVGVDIQTQNDIQVNFQINRTRNLALSFTDTKLFETKTVEYTFGFGYTLDGVRIAFLDFGSKNRRSRDNRRSDRNTQGRQSGGTERGNEMTFTMNFSFRDDVTFAYELDNQSQQVPTRGLKAIRINPSVEYDVNKNLTLQLFVDYNRTIPRTSLSFPITNARGGLKVRFNLN